MRSRRFAVGVLKSFQKPTQSLAEMMRKLKLLYSTRLRLFAYDPKLKSRTAHDLKPDRRGIRQAAHGFRSPPTTAIRSREIGRQADLCLDQRTQ